MAIPRQTIVPTGRRVLAEYLGALLLTTAVGLYVIILIIGPVSGAHLNPVVSMAEVILRRLPIPVALTSTGNTARIPAAVGAYIGAAYFFTSSTSFANPAITIGRIFSDTFAGIAPASAPPYLAAQLVGGLLGLLTVRLLYPHPHSVHTGQWRTAVDPLDGGVRRGRR